MSSCLYGHSISFAVLFQLRSIFFVFMLNFYTKYVCILLGNVCICDLFSGSCWRSVHRVAPEWSTSITMMDRHQLLMVPPRHILDKPHEDPARPPVGNHKVHQNVLKKALFSVQLLMPVVPYHSWSCELSFFRPPSSSLPILQVHYNCLLHVFSLRI